jgi:hypothetical protein
MIRVIALVEGATERNFVRAVVAPWLATRQVSATACLVGKPNQKGGVRNYSATRRELEALLKQDVNRYVTTMFDYYGMPTSWPGRGEAGKLAYAKKAAHVEQATADDVAKKLGSSFNVRRFIPYVQMHEFEALLYAVPEKLETVLQLPELATKMWAIRRKFQTPEQIDDIPHTAPSKRLLKLNPAFEEAHHGPIAAQRAGMDALMKECPHFRGCVEKLVALAQVASS